MENREILHKPNLDGRQRVRKQFPNPLAIRGVGERNSSRVGEDLDSLEPGDSTTVYVSFHVLDEAGHAERVGGCPHVCEVEV